MTAAKRCKDCDGRPERWTPAAGFAGYEISTHGRVRSLDRVDRRGSRRIGKVLALVKPTNRNYLQVGPYRDGRQKLVSVHLLLLESFVGPGNGLLGLHWDDVPTHNHLDNLRWGTQQENAADSIRNGNHAGARKTECLRGHRLVAPNLIVSELPARKCRSCANARQQADQYGDKEIQARADWYYERYLDACG